MTTNSLPLIVGAGPVGTAAALFLAREGIQTRIIDQAPVRSPYSKALAVNPRTLEILAKFGLADRLIAVGKRVEGACLWKGESLATEILFDQVDHPFPFMLALSQATTEGILAEAFQQAGGVVERGVKLVDCGRTTTGDVEAELVRENGQSEMHRCAWLLGADGSHSAVREALSINFPGSSFDREWRLADVPLNTSLAQDRAHIMLPAGGGFVFMLRVVQDASTDSEGAAPSAPLWRIISNRPEPLEKWAHGEVGGPAVWESSFHIGHRMAANMLQGNVFIAGDAAHIHSPMGARGMNLGIEDAWVLSRLIIAGRASEYGKLRYPIDAAVVRKIKTVSRYVKGETSWEKSVRSLAIGLLPRIGPLRSRMMRMLMGLDHPLDLDERWEPPRRGDMEKE